MADPRTLRQQAADEPHPLDHLGGDSDLRRLHRELVDLTAALYRLEGMMLAGQVDPETDPVLAAKRRGEH